MVRGKLSMVHASNFTYFRRISIGAAVNLFELLARQKHEDRKKCGVVSSTKAAMQQLPVIKPLQLWRE